MKINDFFIFFNLSASLELLLTANGNHPVKPKGLKVEFFPKEEVLHEEVKIHRQPEQGDVLPVARQVRRHGRVDDVAHEGARRREPALEEDVPRGKAQGRDLGGGARKKVVRLSHRR